MIKLAVIGSRTFEDYSSLEKALNALKNHISEIVSGGAKGADSLAEKWANNNGIPIKVFNPDWEAHGKSAGFIRNKMIVEYADQVLAFWDGKSKGTKHSIELAKSLKKNCSIINFK